MTRFVTIIDHAGRWAAYVSSAALFLMMLFVGWEVLSRYVFNSPTVWVEEISRYILIWVALLSASFTLSRDEHVSIDLIYILLPFMVQRVLRVLTLSIGFMISVFIAYYGCSSVVHLKAMGQVSMSPLAMPMFIPKAAPAIGFTLLSLQFAAEIVKTAVQRQGDAQTDTGSGQ